MALRKEKNEFENLIFTTADIDDILEKKILG